LGQAKDAPKLNAYDEAEEKWVAISASDTIFSRFFERRLAIFLRPMMRAALVASVSVTISFRRNCF
jgi:hypothetical protein